jgi:hypothetical protein
MARPSPSLAEAFAESQSSDSEKIALDISTTLGEYSGSSFYAFMASLIAT